MDSLLSDYKKYRWFYTKSKKLVVGGKSALQNDELLKKVKSFTSENYCAAHTAEPGSPFYIILSLPEAITEADKIEVATATASFSRAWKHGKKNVKVHFFSLGDMKKTRSMKPGTWGVNHTKETYLSELKLVLTEQENTLRAVSEKTLSAAQERFAILTPGKLEKEQCAEQIYIKLQKRYTKEQILAALPAGKTTIQWL